MREQLEVAANWLREGTLALRGKDPASDLYRVADDCEKAAGQSPKGDAWLQERKGTACSRS